MTTTVEEFKRDVVGEPSSDTSPKALVLPSGLMSSGKTTTVDDVIEYLEESEVDEELSRHESDDFRWRMLGHGIVPESWEKDEYPEDAALEEVVEWTSESEEGSEYDIDWGAKVEKVVPRDEVYGMLGDWTLNSEGIALYDGSNDRNRPLIKEAAELDSNAVLTVQPVLDDAWRRYIEDWGGDSEEFLERAGDFLDTYADDLDFENLEDPDLGGNYQDYGEEGGESLNPVMEDFSRVMSQPGEYLGDAVDDEEALYDEVNSLRECSGRLGEFAENIQQQHETIELAEGLEGIEMFYVADRDKTSEKEMFYVADKDKTSEKARYGHRERPSTGDPENLGRLLRQKTT